MSDSYVPPFQNPCEIVHLQAEPQEIATLLNLRLIHGWVLDRIIKHMVVEERRQRGGGAPQVIYYFKRN